MKIYLKQTTGESKLACLKRVKELTGCDMVTAKELVLNSEHLKVELDVNLSYSDIKREKTDFIKWGFELSGGRDEVLNNLLNNFFVYIIEMIDRKITYKIEEGSFVENDDFYIFDNCIGIKINDLVEESIDGKKITIPKSAVILEINEAR